MRTIRLAFNILTEVPFGLLYLLSGFVDYFFPVHKKISSGNRGTIVFLHAWATQNFGYILLKKYLERLGYRVYMTNFGWQLGDMRRLALKLKSFIRDKHLNNVILVGVSGGAVVSFYYLQRLDGWERVSKFISIGGPLKGSLAAYLGFFSKAARQITPRSQLIKELWTDSIKNSQKIITISAKYDELVPRWSNRVEGAQNITVGLFGHVNLQISRKTYELVGKVINE